MESNERVQTRLKNIRSVQPILSALRTISLGSWQTALKQKTVAEDYQHHLHQMLPTVLPELHLTLPAPPPMEPAQAGVHVLLIIGSERGLCGRFNLGVVEHAAANLAAGETEGDYGHVISIGSRLQRVLQRQSIPVTRSIPFPRQAGQVAELAHQLAHTWLAQYEAYQLDRVDVIYNTYQGLGRFTPTGIRLIPPGTHPINQTPSGDFLPIIETDPRQLAQRIISQLIAVHLTMTLQESAAAEHAMRFQLMESATQNIDRLIEELTMEVQAARRQSITAEMQALVAGAGMLGGRE